MKFDETYLKQQIFYYFDRYSVYDIEAEEIGVARTQQKGAFVIEVFNTEFYVILHKQEKEGIAAQYVMDDGTFYGGLFIFPTLSNFLADLLEKCEKEWVRKECDEQKQMIIRDGEITKYLIEALADKLVIATREDIHINWVGEIGDFDEAQIVFIPLNQIVHLKRGKAGSWWLNYSINGEEVSCWAADMKFAMRLVALAILECDKEG